MAMVLMALALPARAEEGGEAKLTVGGEEHAFVLNAEQSDWSGSSAFTSVNIWTFASDAETRAKFPSFTLGFEIQGGEARAAELRLNRASGDAIERLYGEPDAGGLVVQLDKIESQDSLLSLSGSFTSDVGPSENAGRDIDLSDPLPVSGRFSVTLEKL